MVRIHIILTDSFWSGSGFYFSLLTAYFCLIGCPISLCLGGTRDRPSGLSRGSGSPLRTCRWWSFKWIIYHLSYFLLWHWGVVSSFWYILDLEPPLSPPWLSRTIRGRPQRRVSYPNLATRGIRETYLLAPADLFTCWIRRMPTPVPHQFLYLSYTYGLCTCCSVLEVTCKYSFVSENFVYPLWFWIYFHSPQNVNFYLVTFCHLKAM